MKLGSVDTNAMVLQGQHLHEKLYVLFCLLVVITMPLSIHANSVSIMLLALNWLIEGRWKQKARRFLNSKYAILWVGFFFYHALSIIYSDNKKEAQFELEKKLSFLVFPLIFSTTDFITGKNARTILKYFIGACALASVFCLGNATYFYFQGNPSLFVYHGLGSALGFHAVYFSTFIGFCIFALLYHLLQNHKGMKAHVKVGFIALIFFFFVFMILLSSKTIIVTVFFISLGMGIMRFLKRYSKLAVTGAAVLCLVVFAVIIRKTPYLNSRFQEIFKENYSSVLDRSDYRDFHFTGGTIRVAIWKSVCDVVSEQNALVFGVGIGDAQKLLTDHYNKIHIYPGDAILGFKGFTHYNAHNQYLQFYITLGAVGLIFFLIILLYCYRHALRSRHVLLLSLLILFSAFFFTESALCAHKGVVFFMFFTSLFVLQKQTRTN
ncbi:MAG: O-antigen ligase family protein [Sphingobacteriaceae bacterium]|nr:O-antigen ligase family protein [Sphingobacteriaceae bacterium]